MKVQKVIILKGVNNTGKTHSLKKLIGKIEGFKQTEESIRIQEKRIKYNDTYALLSNKENEYILIITAGDCKRDFDRFYNKAIESFALSKHNIKYLIAACRTRGQLLDFFRNEYKNRLVEIDVIDKNDTKNINNILKVLNK